MVEEGKVVYVAEEREVEVGTIDEVGKRGKVGKLAEAPPWSLWKWRWWWKMRSRGQ